MIFGYCIPNYPQITPKVSRNHPKMSTVSEIEYCDWKGKDM